MIPFNQFGRTRLVSLLLLLGSGVVLILLVGPQRTPVMAAQSSSAGQDETVSPQVEKPGFGILGDSNSDEYRGNDNRGGKYAKTTLNWAEQLQRVRGLNFGPWGDWGEPRRLGYEYNWAHSSSTTQDMIDEGQHIGLAEQVAAGKVEYVFVWIGANDFDTWNGTYEEIYNGTMSDADLQAKVDGIIANITTAVDTVLAAGDVKMVVATIIDKGLTPDVVKEFPDQAKRQRVTDAINEVNSGIQAMAEARNIGFVDVFQSNASVYARVSKSGYLDIGGEHIKFMGRGNEPHYMRLDDAVGHAGTVSSAIVANEVFIKSFNNKYGLGIEPLSEEEILENAGITSSGRWGCLGSLPWLAALLTLTAHKKSPH